MFPNKDKDPHTLNCRFTILNQLTTHIRKIQFISSNVLLTKIASKIGGMHAES